MKIALLTEKYTPDLGGLAISAERFTRGMAGAGYEVHVFARTSSLAASEKLTQRRERISVTRFGASARTDDTLVNWFELVVAEHARTPFDVLHAYFLPQAGFVAAYAGKYLNVRSVISIRGNDIERAAFDAEKFSHVMFALNNASALTTNATELIRKARAFVDREICLIPNGIDLELFRAVPRNRGLIESLGLHRDAAALPIVGFVGELREKKGLATLLRGYAIANAQHPRTLLIVGDVRAGEDQRLFEELSGEIPNARIVVTGVVPHADLPAYYALFDVFAQPSLRDGLPNALLEAMACERAIIATSVGGMRDILEDQRNGIIVDVADAGALGRGIVELLDDAPRRASLGRAARISLEGKFGLAQELQGNLDLYRKLGLNA